MVQSDHFQVEKFKILKLCPVERALLEHPESPVGCVKHVKMTEIGLFKVVTFHTCYGKKLTTAYGPVICERV